MKNCTRPDFVTGIRPIYFIDNDFCTRLRFKGDHSSISIYRYRSIYVDIGIDMNNIKDICRSWSSFVSVVSSQSIKD